MKSLKDFFVGICQNENRWSYYKDPPEIRNCIFDEHEAYEFILKYFKRSGKSAAFDDEVLKNNSEYIKERAIHIISTYLISILISEKLGIETIMRDDNEFNFLYYLFLTCFYHDVGYAYENERDSPLAHEVAKEGFSALYRNCNLKVDRLSFEIYNCDLVELYFKKRAANSGIIDHGIMGGILLINKLQEQFEKAYEIRIDSNQTKDCFYAKDICGRTFRYSEEHFNNYGKAADAIIAHNIWRDTLIDYIDKSKMNREHVLEKIGFNHELCYILSLADTLEPYKRYKNIACFDSIKIDFNRDAEKLVIKILDKNTPIDDKYMDTILELSDWLDVVTDSDEMCIYISIKNNFLNTYL